MNKQGPPQWRLEFFMFAKNFLKPIDKCGWYDIMYTKMNDKSR